MNKRSSIESLPLRIGISQKEKEIRSGKIFQRNRKWVRLALAAALAAEGWSCNKALLSEGKEKIGPVILMDGRVMRQKTESDLFEESYCYWDGVRTRIWFSTREEGISIGLRDKWNGDDYDGNVIARFKVDLSRPDKLRNPSEFPVFLDDSFDQTAKTWLTDLPESACNK